MTTEPKQAPSKWAMEGVTEWSGMTFSTQQEAEACLTSIIDRALSAAVEAKLAVAREALKPFAKDAPLYIQIANPEEYRPANFLSFTVGDLRRAASALIILEKP